MRLEMKAFKLILGLTFFLLLAGCAITIYPILEESDAIFDARLAGSWEDTSSSDQAVISRGTGNSYEIEYTSAGETGRFAGRLGYLGEHLILDVWPQPREGDLLDPYTDFMIPGHIQLFLKISADEIEVATLDVDTLHAAIQSGQVRLSYKHSEEGVEGQDEKFILFGTTEELRQNLGPHLANPSSLGSPGIWRRVQP